MLSNFDLVTQSLTLIALSKRVQELIPDFVGFPTIVLYKGGKLIKTYEGKRDAESVYKFMQNHV